MAVHFSEGMKITKYLVDWDWTVSKCLDMNVVFQTTIFLIPVIRNNKRSPGINSKTSDSLPIFVYITVILSYVSISNCSLNCLNL